MIVELISTILENFIYEITGSGVKSWFDKCRLKKFIKELYGDISDFCEKNECVYLDSSAFEYFIRSTRFLERVIERAVAIKLEKSSKEFLKDEIKQAREIAAAEDVSFTNNEERLIRDLSRRVGKKVTKFYQQKLSVEQRNMVSLCVSEFADLKESIAEFKDGNFAQNREILSAIKEVAKLSNIKAVIIADLFSAELIEGRFSEYDDLAMVVSDKSADLAVYYECMSKIFRSENCTDAVRKIASICNIQIRDNAIRTALPILIYRKEPIDSLMDLPSEGSLRDIVTCLVKEDNAGIFTEDISFDGGLEIHNFVLNKKLVFEEERLTKHVAILFLHGRNIRNIDVTMEEVEKGNRTWLTQLLIIDKKVDRFISENAGDNNFVGLDNLLSSIQENEHVYNGVCKMLRCLYYSILVKANLVMNRIAEAERVIPDNLKNERPLSDYVFAIRNEKKEVDLAEVYDYSLRNETFWLLNNYFVARRDEQELISFCRGHEEIFEKDWPLFFMYLGALKVLGLQDEREKQLRSRSGELEYVYEYWNEMLNIDDSVEAQNAFIQVCREGKMACLFKNSEYIIIERLMNFRAYDIAEMYLAKLEKIGENNYRIKKYKAIIQQSKKNDVEALKWFKTSFDEFPGDVFVIDSLITLSLINKRKVDICVIEAALKADTSRLHMLVAACYFAEGNTSKAKNENIRAILMSKEAYSPVFGQYIAMETGSQSNEIVKITGIDADTAANCRKVDGVQCWLCVYKDSILPASPHVWNNDYHVHIDDAAGFGYLRKRIGDQITIDGETYEITEIMPLDYYLFRTCMAKMTQNGFAKKIAIPSKNGNIDISAFNEWIVQNTPDERNIFNWLEQYNNIQDVPLPLYTYKRFTRLSYLQFVDMILTSSDIFVREMIQTSKQSEKYVISFSALVALFKAGFPAEKIIEAGGVIMASTVIQVDSDAAEIIKEYDRDTVASLGVFEGKVFFSQVDETGKDYWLKEAGSFKKYCESIPTVNSEKDLVGPFFEGFDSKDLVGICDYDAISFVKYNEGYSLVSIEAFLTSLSINEQVRLNVTSIPDWLVKQRLSVEELIKYIKNLMDEGCLMAVTTDVINYLSDTVSNADESLKQVLYSMWDVLLSSVDQYPEKQKLIVVQAMSEVFGLFEEEARNIDKGILQILANNMLLLMKQKIEIFVDEEGYLSFELVNVNPDE